MATVAVLAASFSLREEGRNLKIAKEAFRICDELIETGHIPVLMVRRQVDRALHAVRTSNEYGLLSDKAIFEEKIVPYAGPIGVFSNKRLISLGLYNEAVAVFRRYECTHFVGIAQHPMHQWYLNTLARKDFKLLR